MNWRKLAIRVLAMLFFFMLCGAIASHLLWRQAPLQGVGSASFLFIAGALAMVAVNTEERKRLALAGIIGFVAEVIGVQYGWLFGRYIYTNVLAPNWLGAPLVMICAWFILTGYVSQLLRPFQLAAWIEISLGAAWMTVIDLLIDPLAAHPFNFWNWLESGSYYGIPLRNFLGWFMVSVVIFSIEKIIFRTRGSHNKWLLVIGLGVITLYTVCAFGYSFYLAGWIGIGLVLLHGALVGAKLKFTTLRSLPENIAN
jgi:bisanhydrobacterioruberin hydratase